MSKELPKAYEPQAYEDNIYKKWEESGFFNPDVCIEKGVCKKDAEHFSIVLPPPNVTGTLHIGHASMLAIQDLMVRYHRMKGERTLWVPGTDHAAVATESKVEKLLISEEGMTKPKEELGKEKFLERVQEFAQNSHDTIINQTKKMGSSLDWSREAYTLDDKRHEAVYTVFKKMYDDGLIYRGHRVINWSVKGQSTCSDDELVHIERQSKIYTFKYSEDFPIEIATTRPETKLGDTAVAVNPKDERYKKYIGQTLEVKNFVDSGIDLHIKIIADDHVDMDYGTGAVGVTPAHSSVDFDMYMKQKAQGNDVGLIQVIGKDGNMTIKAGNYVGLDTLEARKKVVESLQKNNLFIKEEDTVQNVGTSDRFGDVVEALPMTQWFIDVNKEFTMRGSEFIDGLKLNGIEDGQQVSLKQLMQQVVRSGQIKILPERFEKVYFNWIDNLRDWCISRQIWFGHQIPIKYDMEADENKFGEFTFSALADFKGGLENKLTLEEKKEFIEVCGSYTENKFDNTIASCYFVGAKYLVSTGKYSWKEIKDKAISISLDNCEKGIFLSEGKEFLHSFVQDTDTLDTWFSSGLWTFSTLGYPDLNAEDLKNYHPTSVMETGYDIIFFWVARMILMTTYTLGDIPFETVYLHGLVRDENGKKMSKSLGNVIDPLDTIKNYGADATRLSLLIGNTPGNDLKLNEEKVASFRNFANKLWNIARFTIGKIQETNYEIQKNIKLPQAKTLSDKYFLMKINQTVDVVTGLIDSCQFSLAGEQLRDFTWNEFADWYLEIAKIEADKTEILNYTINTLLKLWHPFMPFVTEVLWKEMYGEENVLMVEKWPIKDLVSPEGTDPYGDFAILKNIITGVRAFKSDYKIDPVKKLSVVISAGDKKEMLEENAEVIKGLARLEELRLEEKIDKPENHVAFVESGMEVFVNLEGVVDFAKEKERLTKEIKQLSGYVTGLDKKLSNKNFVDNAPVEVVEQEKEKLEESKNKLTKLEEQLNNLK